MARTPGGKVTLANGLVLLLSCVFTSQFADAAKIALRADIAMIATMAPGSRRDFVRAAANKLVEYFEVGEDKVRLALVTAVLDKGAKEKDEWLVQPVTADEAEFQKKVDEWMQRNYNDTDTFFEYPAAIRTARTKVFLNSGDRGKAVLLLLAQKSSAEAVREDVATASKQLREAGYKMYIIARESERLLAHNYTGDPEKVFTVKEEFDDSSVANQMDYVSDRITKDVNGAAGSIPMHWLICCVIAGAVFWGGSRFS